MGRSNLSSRGRRRGQALLLAVLIMIFAALLSAAFIGIVAVNLNQTARQTDKNLAYDSAKAGLDFVKSQLAYSPEGERWFSATSVPIKQQMQTDATLYDRYYSALDKAQGWDQGFLKFPDPRSDFISGPQFLAKVETVSQTLTPQDPDFDKVGALKITVIGLSPDDPTTYRKMIAYKGGFRRAPIAQTLRVVSNWDFKNGTVPVAQANLTAPTTTASVTLMNEKSDFSAIPRPFAITISNARTTVPARSAIVSNVTIVGGVRQLVLATAVAVNPGDRIELAANLGGSNGLDLDEDATTIAIPFATPLSLSDTTPAATPVPAFVSDNQVDGARANGGLIYSGTFNASRLRPFAASYGGNTINPTVPHIPGTIWASGVIAPDIAGAVTIHDIGDTVPTNTASLRASDAAGVFTSAGANGDSLVSDGWNSLKGIPTSSSSLRSVPDFQPPAIDSKENLERYRGLTRGSLPASSAFPASASAYGRGKGIYIDNVQDKEMKTAGTALVEMTQDDLTRMWLSPRGATDSFTRLATPATVTTTSLEERHLRGWVGTDEFLPRGAEIVLGNSPAFVVNTIGAPDYNPSGAVLYITRDSRDDGAANVNGAVLNKAWKDNSGNGRSGVYRQTLAWPQNGVVFAEGNVRIKGIATGVVRSLTVVSMGNIYVEDSLWADDSTDGPSVGTPRKILLIARKNTVMNPTRVLGRPDQQTVVGPASATAPAAPVLPATTSQGTLPVADSSAFQQGDIIDAIDTAGTVTAVAQVAAIDTTVTPNTITANFISGFGNAIPATSIIGNHREAFTPAVSPAMPFTKISTRADAIARRVSISPDVLNPRFAFNHQGSRNEDAFAVTTTGTPDTRTSIITHKRVITAGPPPALDQTASTVSDLNKLFRGDFSTPPTGADSYSSNTTIGGTAAGALEFDMAQSTHPSGTNDDWRYAVTVGAGYAALPSYYLAGVGNRYDYGVVPTLPLSATGWQPNILGSQLSATPTTATTFKIPLATSVGVFVNGIQMPITNEQWNVAATTYGQTLQFGFSPTFQDVSAIPPTLPEDILTGDQSFYQNDAFKSTMDSRSLGNIGTGQKTLAFLQTGGITLPTTPAALPDYRLLGVKLENVSLQTNSSLVDTIAPSHTFEIHAFVYAQTGSWFVIPGSTFEPRLHGKFDLTGLPTKAYFDANSDGIVDAGEFLDANSNNTWDDGEYPDFNRNGVNEDSERLALLRYSRYNYSITFNGAIAENRTAIVNTVLDPVTPTNPPLVQGAVSEWMNNLSSADYKVTPAQSVKFDRIKYIFDPTVALDAFQKDDPATTAVNEEDMGFRLPQTAELYNIS